MPGVLSSAGGCSEATDEHSDASSAADDELRHGKIFSHFFGSDSGEGSKQAEDGSAAISSDPALYWAKLERKEKLRKGSKKGSLRGSFTTNKGIVTFYRENVFAGKS